MNPKKGNRTTKKGNMPRRSARSSAASNCHQGPSSSTRPDYDGGLAERMRAILTSTFFFNESPGRQTVGQNATHPSSSQISDHNSVQSEISPILGRSVEEMDISPMASFETRNSSASSNNPGPGARTVAQTPAVSTPIPSPSRQSTPTRFTPQPGSSRDPPASQGHGDLELVRLIERKKVRVEELGRLHEREEEVLLDIAELTKQIKSLMVCREDESRSEANSESNLVSLNLPSYEGSGSSHGEVPGEESDDDA